jgi:protein phosphatase-4 regulatory subunit 3
VAQDPTIKAKIHQIYRLQYLKDVVLARILDDATYSMLNSFIYFHQVDIVTHLQNNVTFLTQLFHLFGQHYGSLASLKDAAAPPSPAPLDRQRQGILFLQQFCAMAKNLQVQARNAFYRQMADKGLLRVIEYALAHPPHAPAPTVNGDAPAPAVAASEGTTEGEEHDVRGATVEILMTLIEHDPGSVRGHSLRQHDADPAARTLMRFIIELFHSEPDLGIKAQFAEAVRVLVQSAPEPGTLEAMQARGRPEDPEADKFLQYFYDHCAEALVKPLLDLPDPAASAGAHMRRPVRVYRLSATHRRPARPVARGDGALRPPVRSPVLLCRRPWLPVHFGSPDSRHVTYGSTALNSSSSPRPSTAKSRG